jgi:hypothetical protein
VRLYIEQAQVRVVKDKADALTVPAAAITEVSYGQDVHRRAGAAIGLAVVSFGGRCSWRSPSRRSTMWA